MREIIYRIIDAPLSFHAFTIPDEDGVYNVYVNSNLCPEARERAIRHELEHIRRGHLEDERPVAELEKEVENALQVLSQKHTG